VQLSTALVGAAGYTRGRYPGRHDINPFPRLLVRYQPTKCGVMWKPFSPNSDSKKSPIGPCSRSQTQVLMNLGALLGAATTAVLGTAESGGAVAMALAVWAAGAFASALCATKRSGPQWLPVLAVVLNVAAVLEPAPWPLSQDCVWMAPCLSWPFTRLAPLSQDGTWCAFQLRRQPDRRDAGAAQAARLQ
jgi:hypothetical protein